MIRRFIPDERLSILIVMVDVTETRMLNGKRRIGRKRTAKINCIPDSVNSVIMLTSPEDYLALVPKGLSDGFTADEFERISGLHGIGAHGALMLLLQLSILRRERRGREHYRYYFDNNSAT